MGSLYRQKNRDGTPGHIWWVKYYTNGRPVRESTRTDSKKAARDVLLALERRHLDLEAGTLRLDPGMTKNGQGHVIFRLARALRDGWAEPARRSSPVGIASRRLP